MISVVIADDHGVLRAGLRALLEAHDDIEVLDEVADGKAILPCIMQHRPNVLLLDLTMPNLEPMQMITAVAQDVPTARTLVLSVHEDAGIVKQALAAGANGYINKRAVGGELIYAIQTVHKGEMYLHPSLTASFVSHSVETPAPPPANPTDAAPLTPREAEVMALTVRGLTSKQMADQLGLSKRTVDVHRANIKRKLNLNSRSDWVVYYEQHLSD
ncbi:MAG: response regulator transcription factor [Chloroflexota bacterium]